MSGLLSLNDVQGYASLQGSTTQDQVNSLQLTVAFSSDTEPAARTIALWANQGTPEPAYPLTSSRGATTACSIGIDVDDNVSDANSISFVPIVANPGDATTVWIDSGTAHLMRGAVDLETTGTGDVVGPASSTDTAIATFDGITGKLLQTTGITIDPLDNISDANSVSLIPVAANPGDATTVWIDSGTAHLMRGAVDLETTGTGDVVGPASSTDTVIATFDGITGKLLQATGITINPLDNTFTSTGYISADSIELTTTGSALFLPANQDVIIYLGSSSLLKMGSATTSMAWGLGACQASAIPEEGCIILGYEAGYQLGVGSLNNTIVGNQSMRSATSANTCTSIGRGALYSLTTGERHIAIGQDAGSTYTTESDNITIGNVGVASDAGFIRCGTAGTHLQNFQAGVVGVTTTANDAIPVLVSSTGQLGTVSSSIKTKENIEDLEGSEVVYKLRPVSFNYKDHADKSKKNIGLIAEEVEEVYPDMVIKHPNPKTGELEIRTVDYPRLSILLLKEVQGLHDKYNQLSLQNMSLANELMKIKAVLKL
jgi:hypothetical protein